MSLWEKNVELKFHIEQLERKAYMLKLTLVYCWKKTNIILYDIHYTYLNVKMLEKCVFHLKIEINPDVNLDILTSGYN